MTYIDNCKTYLREITGAFEPAQSIPAFFTEKEINDLLLLQFQLADRLKYTATSNNIQPVCNIDSLFEKLPWLADKFKAVIGDFMDNHSGNYYITTQLHDAHVDLLSEEETLRPEFAWSKRVIPYKSCVIPLIITPGAEAQTAFFHQRHVGYSVTLDRANVSSQDNSDYTLARMYPTMYNIDGSESGHYEPYERKKFILFPQIPLANLTGLSVETVLDYDIGSVMIFDACQIHASCVKRNKPNYRWLKSGINIQFYKEI